MMKLFSESYPHITTTALPPPASFPVQEKTISVGVEEQKM